MVPHEPISARRAINDLPDALDAWPGSLRHRSLAVFLDFDGTLTPIVDHPEDAHLSDEAREAVARIAQRHSVAVISGRDLDDVRQRVALPDLIYAGSHGFDIAGPDGLAFQHAGAIVATEALATAERVIRDALRPISGAYVERKRFTLAAHYRNVAPDKVSAITRAVERAVSGAPALRQREGKMVVEIQPAIDWHKGRAVRWILDVIASRDVVPVYIGDDLTDEDAFAVIEPIGLGIVVGEGARATGASLRLRDPAAVLRWLSRVAAEA